MRSVPLVAVALCVPMLLAACGGAGAPASDPPPLPASDPQVLAVSGPLDPAVGTAFTVTGLDFPGTPGDEVEIRLTSADGLSLATCDSSHVSVVGALESATVVRAIGPVFPLTRTATAYVTLAFPDGSTATSETPLARLVGAPDPSRDQDEDGVLDPCDPDTYDFASVSPGGAPSETTSLDDPAGALVVRSGPEGPAVAFPATYGGVAYERFDRVRADFPFQDLTVYLDVETAGGWLTVDLWSEGSYLGWSGGGILLQVGPDGLLRYYERRWTSILSPKVGPAAPASGRLRLRLLKGEGFRSTLHVDAWVDGGWVPDHAVFDVADDHAYRGQDLSLSGYGGGQRGVRRVSVVRHAPPVPLAVGRDPAGASDWRVHQRDHEDRAEIPLRVLYRLGTPGRLEARVVEAESGDPLVGFDWGDHGWPLPPRDGGRFEASLPGVPTGGNYNVRVRLLEGGPGGTVLAEDGWSDVAVGDVWIAGGQSNMSGYSGGMSGVETPIAEAHVFHNDGTWKQAVEPMDDGWEQVDAVSRELPYSSCLLAFARELVARTGVPVAVVPASLGGTNLYAQWARRADRPDDRSTLYGSMLWRARAASPSTPPRGLLWFQGESDALALRTGAQYLADLQAFISALRSDLGRPDLAFLCGQLGTYSAADLASWLPIQEAQRLAVRGDPRSALGVAVDLPRSDGIHFNVLGYRTLGYRFATAARRLVFGHAVDETTDLVSAAAAAGDTAVRLVYERPVSGGAPALFRVTDASGDVPVSSVSTVGADVTLDLGRALSGDARVSYGWSVDPLAAWLVDGTGVAVPVFDALPLSP